MLTTSLHAKPLQPPSSPSTDHQITFQSISTYNDICALADLRYDEWIHSELTSTNDDTIQQLTPSRNAFRMATNDIFQERKGGGAIAFLAFIQNPSSSLNNNQQKVTVGAAEVSPIEFDNSLVSNTSNSPIPNLNQLLYVTDVVISKQHRRMGIGNSLMINLEEKAKKLGSKCLFLHVEHDNKPALQFYKSLGYTTLLPPPNQQPDEMIVNDETQNEKWRTLCFYGNNTNKVFWELPFPNNETHVKVFLDTTQLAKNAGTEGQLVLVKLLNKTSPFNINVTSQHGNKISGGVRGRGGGFGASASSSSRKKLNTRSKKKNKSKR